MAPMSFPQTVFVLAALAMNCAFAPQGQAQMVLTNAGDGGSVPGTSRVEITGTSKAPYLLLFSGIERSWKPLPGLDLEIDLEFLPLCLSSSLFLNTLDAAGRATTDIPVPNLPGLYGKRMSLQSFELSPLGNASNMIRITLQEPDTFADTLAMAASPMVTGKGFLQKDGTVLLLGGSGPVVQQYDPNLEEFEIHSVVPSGNILATQTLLSDGTILVAGGIGITGQPVQGAFLFDPATKTVTALSGMATARAGHAAARLKDGRVLLVGGASNLDFTNLVAFLAGIQNTSEFYDPSTKTFQSGPSLLEQKVFHSATTLGNGEVLVAGGLSVIPVVNVPIVSPTAQAYTPSLGIFGFPRLMAPRMLHGAVALGNGRALLAGGLTIDFTKFLQTQNILDLKINSVADAVTYNGGLFGGFSASMPLSKGRLLPAVAPLGNSGALIAGGFNLDISAASLVFEPLAESDILSGSTVTPTGKMNNVRAGAVAVPLPDGTVLVVGGGSLQAEIYQPR
jgi:hypothetical protein